MNAVHGSILENLGLIEIVYEETVDAFKSDRTNTSDSKEVTVSQFIGSYLPNDFQVKPRSKIYSKTQETYNIDCVVLAPNHPRLITPKREIVLAEGVFFVVEVKPDISTLTIKSEFYRGLQQIKSVKNIERDVEKIDAQVLMGLGQKPKYYDKIPGVIFTSKSSTIQNTINFISNLVSNGDLNYEEIPDLIVCLDKGIIVYSPFLKSIGLSKRFESLGHIVPDKGFFTFESSDKSTNLITFLRYVLTFQMPTIQVSSFIVSKYLSEIVIKHSNIKMYELK